MNNSKRIYRAAIYVRLSKEDGDLDDVRKAESNSISNQKSLILNYLKDKEDIEIVSIREDDGYSGATFDRPAFKLMMQDVKDGIIDCIVVKDLSRFAREYIDAGRYIERMFPAMGIRFIAINDAYDSADTQAQGNEIIIPFKNLINDAYCRDISIKIRSHLETKRQNGEFVGNYCVYGYKKSEIDHNVIVPDEYAGPVVQDIFHWIKNGMSLDAISDKLNALGILSPMAYKLSKGENYKTALSRLGRDYIETGNLVERVFPMMNIRFVAITDNYDSSKKDADLMVAVTNIANDLYAKDISKKISASKQEAMEKGIPTGNVAYGYKVVFNENKVKVMVEDKEAADVVRWIFNEAEKGTLHSVIAAELNAKHILTPAQYRVRHNIEKLEKLSGVKWTVDTLSQILKNEVYIGRYVTGKDRVCLYRHEKRHTTNKDEWYVFENHHIALIAKEQFYAVQKNKRKVIKPTKKQTVNMLKGKIICGCCGSSIHIHPEKHAKVYLCTHRKRYGKDSCNCLPVKVDDVYAAVLAVIKEQIQVFVDREMILKEHHNDSRVIRQEQVYTEAVNKCVKEMDRLMELKSGLYADYTEELLDEKEYLQLNREYSQRIEKLKIQADEYRQAASQYESAEKTVAQLKAEMLRFKGKRKLTQEMVDLFVAQVRIYENKNLEIVLNYEDELKKFAELNMEREAG